MSIRGFEWTTGRFLKECHGIRAVNNSSYLGGDLINWQKRDFSCSFEINGSTPKTVSTLVFFSPEYIY